MDDIRKLFIIVYAIVKDLLPFETTNKNIYLSSTKKTLAILLSIITLITVYGFLLPFALFRLLLRIILKMKHRESFGGILEGQDAIFEMNPRKTVINVILIYTCKDDTTIMLSNLRNCLNSIFNSSFKFSSHVRKVLGYCYYLKNQSKLDDIMDVRRYNGDECMTKEMLVDHMEKNCLAMSKNQTWGVTIFTQPIIWGGNEYHQKVKQYAIIWTLRHCLGDGPAIVTIFQNHTKECDSNDIQIINFEKLQRQKNEINLNNVCIRRNPVTIVLDGSALTIEDNSKWYLASHIDQTNKYISRIKRIKDELSVSFTDVLSAAIVASVYDYVRKRKVNLDNFSIGKVIRLNTKDLLKMQSGRYKFDDMRNDFSLLAQTLPRNLENKSMKYIIEHLRRYNESLRYAVDPFVAYVFLRSICSYLPTFLTRISCKSFMDSTTVGLTNLLGFQKRTICDYPIQEVFFFAPDFLNTGFTFSIFSYDRRLQIILSSRVGFVHNRKELQEILDNVFTYIDKLEKETF